jgi:flagellar basal-body rod modification protein FlgD
MLSNIGQTMAQPAQQQQFGEMGMQVEASARKSAELTDAEAAAPKFGEVWSKIMAKNGGGDLAKPREAKKTMGKDDFLRLMITQMKYQDPSKPFEMEKMGSELAQLSSMEQLQNLNTTLKQLVSKDQPLERLAMTNLIGKTVVVDRDRFPHTEGQAEVLHFNLPQDARQVTVAVVDSGGEVLLEQDLGPQKQGENTFNWDGKKANTMPAKSGSYTLMVNATDSRGSPIPIPKNVNAPVIGVSYEGDQPVLLVGTPGSPDKVDLKQVVKIIDQGPSMGSLIPGAQPISSVGVGVPTGPAVTPASGQGTVAGGPGKTNFFSFEKGRGSETIDPSRLSADARKALEAYEQQAREAAQAAEGFPNGLGEENADLSPKGDLVE